MTTQRMPVVFISHGAPDALLHAHDAVAQWAEIGRRCPKPAAILMISAHWEERIPTASLAEAPATIHDFSGFAPSLHAMSYPAPGAPALARQAVALLEEAGITAVLDPNRGLDHGAWVPLTALYPQADIPVTQLSLIKNGSPANHLAMGKALTALRWEGVLIIATGSITHNFGWLDWSSGAPIVPKAQVFNDWVTEQLSSRNVPALLAYRAAPYGAEAHPTEEHFLPLFVALGAAGEDTPLGFHPSLAYGGLSMDAYLWQGNE
jgi:4,5-DOPA dioxygenase extradiol